MVRLAQILTLGLSGRKRAQLIWTIARKESGITDLFEDNIYIERKKSKIGPVIKEGVVRRFD